MSARYVDRKTGEIYAERDSQFNLTWMSPGWSPTRLILLMLSENYKDLNVLPLDEDVENQPIHSAFCIARTEAAHLWDKMWPNACKTCHGAGIVGWSENQAPFGSGYYWPESFSESCNHCEDKGLCPRCGQPLWHYSLLDRFADKFHRIRQFFAFRIFGSWRYINGVKLIRVRWLAKMSRWDQKYEAFFESDKTFCPHCGWHHDLIALDARPNDECDCWEDYEPDISDEEIEMGREIRAEQIEEQDRESEDN